MITRSGFQTFVRSRSDIVIKQLDKYFSGGPVRQWLVLDPLLRGNVENERDLGLERLRQTIMDIASKCRSIFGYFHLLTLQIPEGFRQQQLHMRLYICIVVIL